MQNKIKLLIHYQANESGKKEETPKIKSFIIRRKKL